MRWQQVFEREKEPRQASGHGGREECRGPAVEPFAGQQTE